MFQPIRDYAPIDVGGRWYGPRAYGDPQPDGTWKGWLIFFPLIGGDAIAPPQSETTPATWAALTTWANGVGRVYLHGTLERAVTLAQQAPSVISQLAAAEYEALQGAERLDTAADVERAVADLDDAAADLAREEAGRIRRERLATESALAATEEAAAKVDAAMHEEAVRDAKDVAADPARRRRSAEAEAARPEDRQRAGMKKW
jgi:hypothetical protein